MYFTLTPEQEAFREVLRDLLEKARRDNLRAVIGNGGFDAATWRALTADLGAVGLNVPEDLGGAGMSLVDAAVAAEELGRVLAPVPFLETAVVIDVVLRWGTDDQRRKLLPALMAGQAIGTLADSGVRPPVGGGVRGADRGDGRWELHGSVGQVPFAAHSDLFVVPAAASDQVRLFLVERGSRGATVEPEKSFDLTRPLGRLHLDGAPAELLGAATVLAGELEMLDDIARCLLSFEMLGAARGCLEQAVTHARTRQQFGRAIGSFQAVKHRLAEMAVEIDASSSAAMFAIMLAQAADRDLAATAALAKAQAADTLTFCARWNVQAHGGIAFTWEHDAHLYLRRAAACAIRYGNSAWNRERSVAAAFAA